MKWWKNHQLEHISTNNVSLINMLVAIIFNILFQIFSLTLIHVHQWTVNLIAYVFGQPFKHLHPIEVIKVENIWWRPGFRVTKVNLIQMFLSGYLLWARNQMSNFVFQLIYFQEYIYWLQKMAQCLFGVRATIPVIYRHIIKRLAQDIEIFFKVEKLMQLPSSEG